MNVLHTPWVYSVYCSSVAGILSDAGQIAFYWQVRANSRKLAGLNQDLEEQKAFFALRIPLHIF